MPPDQPDAGDQHDADAPRGMTFADLGIDQRVLESLLAVGYETPSPIQEAAIPALLDGRDVIGLAQTGTGKTAAFAVPMLSRLELGASAPRTPQALVLAPTRELALQVSEAFERYAAHLPGVRVLPVYGGQGYGVQLSALRRGVHVVVGTPGRVMDHLDKGTLDLSGLRFLALDEADEMLSMGFAEDIETILSATPSDKQVALFSATMPKQIRRLADQYLHDPVEVSVERKTATVAHLRQRVLQVAHAGKVDALTRILEVESFEAVIVFVRTKQATETVAERLRARGYSAAAINGDVVQAQRERTVGELRDGRLDVLVATDVAARGLDVSRITHVVNYDIPTDTESYVHRVGRTGRAGRDGDAISFVTPRERHLLRAIEKATGQQMTPMRMPTVDDVNATRIERFTDSITQALGDDQLGFYRDLVARYENEHDVPATDVAAALAVLLTDGQPLLLDPEPERAPAASSAGGPREGRGPSRDQRGGGGRFARYRIAVGRRHKVEPRQIVGALANEGGLGRGDFGKIDIRGAFSIVELPADLGHDVLDRLSTTRISGKLIDLEPDRGPRREGNRTQWSERPPRDDRRERPRAGGKTKSRHAVAAKNRRP